MKTSPGHVGHKKHCVELDFWLIQYKLINHHALKCD